jgi:hypothetical protein
MTPTPDHPIDRAVRAHLDTEAAKVDARAVLARVKAAQAPVTPSTHRRSWLRWAAVGGAAVAACLLVGLLFTNPPREVSAEELIAEAKTAHEGTADRCYDVTADWDITPFVKRFQFRPPLRQAQVWTRGDQFVILATGDDGPPLAFGQEPGGRVWFAPTRRHAIVFDPDELNEPLARYCELMSLRLVSTLGELLQKFDLFRKDGGGPGEPIRIEANLRPGLIPQARFRKVELELDPERKVVRKAVLHRNLNGEPVGTIAFTLAQTAPMADEFYGVEGHVDPGAVIHDGRPLPNPPAGPRNKAVGDLLKRWQNRQK